MRFTCNAGICVLGDNGALVNSQIVVAGGTCANQYDAAGGVVTRNTTNASTYWATYGLPWH